MEHYDLVIIGGGAGAFAAAIKANELNAKTAMINTGLPLGGTCVNVGCVPSKRLLYAAEIMHTARNHGIPGIELDLKSFNFNQVVDDELNLVNSLRQEKYENVLAGLANVTLIEGDAKFTSLQAISVSDASTNQNVKTITAPKFIIATGSTATVPPIDGIAEVGYVTHIEILKLQRQPKELIVVGAGPLGLEFAQLYARFGTKVTILQHGTSIFHQGERELTEQLAAILEQEGITIKTNIDVLSARMDGEKKTLLYKSGEGMTSEVSGDEILLAIGKTPNTKALGLDLAGVTIDDKQAIVVNKTYQTSQPYIYAVGDVINFPLRLETTAGREGTLAASNALNNTHESLDYTTVPYTIFTDPQLAGIGLTEEETIKQLGRCLCRTVMLANVPKAIILNRTEGLIKMVIHPETHQVLGVHILAPHAGELIAEAMMLVKNKNTINDIINTLPIFPTLSEGIKLAALSFKKDISQLSCCI